MAKMSGQGVRTHHWRAAEHGLWQAVGMTSKACLLQSMIRTTYLDRICYRPGCDIHECRVLLPKGIRIGERTACLLGESGWSCSGQRRAAQLIPPSLDISQPDGRGRRFNFPGQTCPDPLIGYFTSGYLTAKWERRTFQLPRSDMSGSSDSAYPESFSLNIQYRGVLLKLPDISDQFFEIFCFRYLMSKSPNSPCNPPIIGFLSL